MSLVHLHLLLNHVPSIGAVLVAALLAWALLRNSNEVAKFALGSAVVIGLMSLAVFFTGEPAEEAVEDLAGVSEAMIERHENVALIATIAAAAFGVVALGVLSWFRGRNVSRVVTGASLAGALVLAAGMAWTANLGGQIRHTEIRSGSVASADAGSTDAADDDDDDDDDEKRKDQ